METAATNGNSTYYVPTKPIFEKTKIPLVPALLMQKIEKFAIALPPMGAIGDRVFVYPLPESESAHKVGSIHLAPTTTKKYTAHKGVIVKMGARAHEELFSHGIELGHTVLTAKFTPTEHEYVADGKVHTVLLMRSGDIQASEELDSAYAAGDAWLTRDERTGRVELNDRDRIDPVQSDDQG
jgi:hypothetical protein